MRCVAEFARRPPGLRDSGNRVFENQLIGGPGLQEQRKFVKALDPAQQLRSVDQIDRYGRFLAAGEIEKAILDILWWRF